MVINGINGIDATRAYAARQNNQVNATAKKQDAGKTMNRADILDISPEARQTQAYRAALKELPEVREDLVMAVKKGIQAGTYKPDPEKIAEGLLELNILVRR